MSSACPGAEHRVRGQLRAAVAVGARRDARQRRDGAHVPRLGRLDRHRPAAAEADLHGPVGAGRGRRAAVGHGRAGRGLGRGRGREVGIRHEPVLGDAEGHGLARRDRGRQPRELEQRAGVVGDEEHVVALLRLRAAQAQVGVDVVDPERPESGFAGRMRLALDRLDEPARELVEVRPGPVAGGRGVERAERAGAGAVLPVLAGRGRRRRRRRARQQCLRGALDAHRHVRRMRGRREQRRREERSERAGRDLLHGQPLFREGLEMATVGGRSPGSRARPCRAFPSRAAEQWPDATGVPDHSGGSAPDLHRLP